MKIGNTNYCVIKRSKLDTSKLFVEFYLPDVQILFDRLHQAKYPVFSLGQLNLRLFQGPFGSNRKVDMYQDSGIPYVRVKDVLPEGINTARLTYISEEKHQELKQSRVVSGNILLTIAGRIGTAAVFPEYLSEGNITGHIAGIEVTENINPYYLAAYFNSKFGNFQLNLLGHRTTRPELNLSELKKILVIIPPRTIQDKIAQIMQEAYYKKQEKLVQSNNLVKKIETYLFIKLELSRHLPEDQQRFLIKCSKLHRFDVRYFSSFYTQLEQLIEVGKYPTQELANICKKITNGFTPSKASYTKEGYIVVKAGSLTKTWQINWSKIAFTSEKFFEKAKKAYIQDGDLLILSASHQLNYIGRSFALVRNIPTEYNKKCMAVGELIIIRANQESILPEYLLTCFVIKPIQELVNRMSRGQTAHLYADDLKKLRIPLPPIEIQQEIIYELERRRSKSINLQKEAETIVIEAKTRVERMILGEDNVK